MADVESSTVESSFVEVHHDNGVDGSATAGAATAPDEVEVYVSPIQPQVCGEAIKELSAVLPLRLPDDTRPTTDCGKSKTPAEGHVCLSHLKRVRRPGAFASVAAAPETPTDSNIVIATDRDGAAAESIGDDERRSTQTSSPHKSRKRRRSSNDGEGRGSPEILEIVIGTTIRVDSILGGDYGLDTSCSRPNLQRILDQYGLILEKRFLPGRPAKSQDEVDGWNDRVSPAYKGVGWWPTVFFRKRTEEFKEEERRLTETEICHMEAGMNAAVADARDAKKVRSAVAPGTSLTTLTISGAVIVDPIRGNVISTACGERMLQGKRLVAAATAEGCVAGATEPFPDVANPLCSSIILAVQGVSRKERNAAASKRMDSDEFKNGQYLCTGYDVYVTKEPDIFEAMAMVHSRVRRVIYGIPDAETGGLGGTGKSTAVNSLPGTNHHYRVFHCVSKDIIAECRDVHTSIAGKR